MRDRYFREDENELPYLVSEKRDDYRGSGSVNLKTEFENVPFREFRSYVNRLLMPQNDINTIISSIRVQPKGCTCSIRQDGHIVNINLFLKNEYLASEFHAKFDSKMYFYPPYHNYRNLESSQWFRNEVKRVEREISLKYYACGGGYKFNFKDDRLEVLDDVDVLAYFSDGGQFSDSHSYRVDFKAKKLVEYHVHDWIELYEPYL